MSSSLVNHQVDPIELPRQRLLALGIEGSGGSFHCNYQLGDRARALARYD
jgi:hypothetical protein